MQNYNYPPQQPQQQTSVLGIISLVFAIIALIVSFIPCFGYFAIFIALIPIIASIIVLVQAKKTGEPKGLAIAGLAIGGVALLIGIFWGTLLGGIGSQIQKDLRENQDRYNINDTVEEPYYYEDDTDNQEVEIFTEETDTIQ
ncbi:DUF4190 domain-containing protein [Myroides sp. M-43]|uniref:DUF4190 domain-containing protein n=1 Tax=Myroides oncorhynchi TaxID=2893756 RepID=UPI001E337658|nr:DUF4190 domain-containing protein [Myroides oncorhynchi]MCC9041633.1 DUF4190 domain-containing protein [Myroides oncorhynchi]